MKIAVLGTRGFPKVQGGVEAHCENLYSRLAELGCEVVVFGRKPYLKRDSPLRTISGSDLSGTVPVKVIPLNCPKNKFLEAFVHTFKGILAAKKLKPDILHIHAIGPSLFIPLARLLGLKVVMTNHGPDYERKKWGRLAKSVLMLGENLGTRYANGIISISESNAERIRKKYKRNATVIPNGVVMPELARARVELEKGRYVLAVGRFVPEKGLDCLVEAFREDPCGWKLVIAGKADHPDKYSQALKRKAAMNKNIILTGFLSGEPLRQLYSHAGLFVLPSYYEGLPIVLLEAMSYGLSCIASDIPANREVGLSEDRFFQAGDVQVLATKIEEFIQRPLTEEEKRRQIDLVAEKYDWGKIALRTVEVYRQVHKGTSKIVC